jgi:hypothetical protein
MVSVSSPRDGHSGNCASSLAGEVPVSHANHTVKILRINIFLKHDTLCPPKLLLDCVVIRSYKDDLLKSQFQLEKTAGSKRFDPDHGWNHESNATTMFKKRSSAIEPASRGRKLPARRVHFSSLSLETEHLANKLFTVNFFSGSEMALRPGSHRIRMARIWPFGPASSSQPSYARLIFLTCCRND